MKFLEVHSVKGENMALLLIQLKIQLESSALMIQLSFMIQNEKTLCEAQCHGKKIFTK